MESSPRRTRARLPGESARLLAVNISGFRKLRVAQRGGGIVARLVDIVRRCDAEPLVVCPPPFDGYDLEASFRLALDCDVVVAPPYSVVSGDVEHLDAAGHETLARAVFGRL